MGKKERKGKERPVIAMSMSVLTQSLKHLPLGPA